MNTLRKIRLKIFLLSLIFEMVVNALVLTFAYFSDKILETVFFYLVWQMCRKSFPKVFHYKFGTALGNIFGCGICSVGIFVIAIRNILPLYSSIFSSVIIGIGINYCLYFAQCYLDLKDEQLKQIKTVYDMNEAELRLFARKNGLKEEAINTLVLRVIHNKRWCEIQRELNYSKDGIRYHKQQINKKLKLDL